MTELATWTVLGIKGPFSSWVAVAMMVCVLPLALRGQMALERHKVFLRHDLLGFPARAVAASYSLKCQLLPAEWPNLAQCLALARLKPASPP